MNSDFSAHHSTYLRKQNTSASNPSNWNRFTRPEYITRGRKLYEDPNYPDQDVIMSVAKTVCTLFRD